MDSYSYYFLFPKYQTHAYTRFENGCIENSTQKLLTKYSTEEKINTLFVGLGRPELGRTVPSVLSTARGMWPRAVLKTSGTVFPKTDLPAGK